MVIKKHLLLSLSLVLILEVADSFDYHEKELESEAGLQGMYNRWRDHHKVSEISHERFNVFKYNVQNIHNINKMNRPYKLKVNKFAAMTKHEIRSIYADSKMEHYNALNGIPKNDNMGFSYNDTDAKSLPKRMDWREHNAVTPVKNQKHCGGCFAFAAVAAIEGINAIRTGQLTTLSEQQIIDCDTSARSNGCDGGVVCSVYQFVHEHGGIATNESYPYLAKKETCDKSKFGHHSITIDGKEYVPRHNEEAMLKAVAHQPVSIAIDSCDESFTFYSEGIYTGPCGLVFRHAMLNVGYDETPDGMKYWIIKNSWGADWGNEGFIYIQRGLTAPEGLCNMYGQADYPIKSSDTKNIEL